MHVRFSIRGKRPLVSLVEARRVEGKPHNGDYVLCKPGVYSLWTDRSSDSSQPSSRAALRNWVTCDLLSDLL
jgi:hypothetical protein